MIFKIAGSLFIITASVFVMNQGTLKLYYTYRFLNIASDIVYKIIQENSSNLTYGEIFRKICFDSKKFIFESEINRYIDRKEIDVVKVFFSNIGRRNKAAESKFLAYNLSYFEKQKNNVYKKYIESQKVNLLCGLTFGLFISIILI